MDERESWWVSFFKGHWGEIQRSGYAAERTVAEVDFMCAVLELLPGYRVLDMPCGEGRHSIELALRGMRVCGVDLNEDAVSRARKRASALGAALDFREADMRSFCAEHPYDAAVCFSGSFGYFADAENERVIENVAGMLRPGGRFLLDTPTMESLFAKFRERDWHWATQPPGAVALLEERTWKPEASRLESTWRFVDNGAVSTYSTSIRIYSCRELIEMFHEAGFKDVRALDTKTGQPFKMGGSRVSLVGTK